jgi:hypothetical protein
LDDLLCITKASLDDHLNHLRLILTWLPEAGLWVNAPKDWTIIHIVSTLFMAMEVNLHFTLKPYANHLGSSISQPVSRTHKHLLYGS